MSVEKSYTLTDEQNDYVEKLADKLNVTRGHVIRLAVMNLWELTDVMEKNETSSRREMLYEFEGIVEKFENSYHKPDGGCSRSGV